MNLNTGSFNLEIMKFSKQNSKQETVQRIWFQILREDLAEINSKKTFLHSA